MKGKSLTKPEHVDANAVPLPSSDKGAPDGPMPYRVNVGCGATPTPGWVNLDNSLTVRIAQRPWLVKLLAKARLLKGERLKFARAVLNEGITWANASRLPLPDDSVDFLYSSHMVEHLTREEAKRFLSEARRVLVPHGTIRLALPDLQILVSEYVEHGDADHFVERTLLAIERERGLLGKVRSVAVGDRGHAWMYDGRSLTRLLEAAGFENVEVLPPGVSTGPTAPGLNLAERSDESVYVEARCPVP